MKFLYVRSIAVIIFLFLLAACSPKAFDEDEALLRLQQEGTLIEVTMQDIQARTPQLAQVFIGDLEELWTHLQISVDYPNVYHVAFDNARITGPVGRPLTGLITISEEALALNFIEEGTFIASIESEEAPAMLISYRELQMEIARFNTATSTETGQRRALIETLRDEVAFAENWEQAALELEREELALELFLLNTARRRVELNEQLDRLNLQIEGEYLHAPISGFVTHTTAARSGVTLAEVPHVFSAQSFGSFVIHGPGHAIMSIVDDSVVHFRVRARSNVFRFGDIITVHDVIAGGVSFDVMVANDPLVRPVNRNSEQDFIFVPADPIAFAAEMERHGLRNWDLRNISLRPVATVLHAVDAVLVSRWALNIEFQSTYVFLYENGEISRRYVTVGTVLEHAEILSGLEPGQWVVIP